MDIIPVKIKVDLEFVWDDLPPKISVAVDNTYVFQGSASQNHITVTHDCVLQPGDHAVIVNFYNKSYRLREPGSDMAVIVRSVAFQDSIFNFAPKGQYRPEYPEPWCSEQQLLGQTLDPVISATYLGWNGEWRLAFSTPIYQWMHRTLNLGWLI